MPKALDGLRDRIACAALQGLLAMHSHPDRWRQALHKLRGEEEIRDALARDAYDYADAMLRARRLRQS